MQQRRVRLGDILDDYCPRERRITNHAVVAMIEDEVKQTRCTTCDADHEYKQAKAPARRKKPESALVAGTEAAAFARPPVPDPEPPVVVEEALTALGDAYLNANQYAPAEAAYAEAVRSAEQHGGPATQRRSVPMKKIVHIVGTGTIGEPLIGLFTDFRKYLGIDEVTFHKRTPMTTERAKVNHLMERGAQLAVDSDKVADFEKVMAKLHEALANSDKPERKQQAAGWKLYKASDPGPNGAVLYINFISPTLKGADYTISKILAEVFPQEVQQLFPLYRDAFAGLARAELSLIQDFSTPAPKPAN